MGISWPAHTHTCCTLYCLEHGSTVYHLCIYLYGCTVYDVTLWSVLYTVSILGHHAVKMYYLNSLESGLPPTPCLHRQQTDRSGPGRAIKVLRTALQLASVIFSFYQTSSSCLVLAALLFALKFSIKLQHTLQVFNLHTSIQKQASPYGCIIYTIRISI